MSYYERTLAHRPRSWFSADSRCVDRTPHHVGSRRRMIPRSRLVPRWHVQKTWWWSIVGVQNKPSLRRSRRELSRPARDHWRRRCTRWGDMGRNRRVRGMHRWQHCVPASTYPASTCSELYASSPYYATNQHHRGLKKLRETEVAIFWVTWQISETIPTQLQISDRRGCGCSKFQFLP